MNTNKQKNYLVIKNVCSDKNLVSYLEQICQDEHVSILYEEFNQFDVWNGKQSIYAQFDAKHSSDIILWSYDSIKLEYINYLYKDFEARYRNTGNIVSRIIENISDGDNSDESEKIEENREDILDGFRFTYQTFDRIKNELRPNNWTFQNYLRSDLDSKQERKLKEDLRENLASWATGDWSIDNSNKKPTFKQKISNFYNKYSEKIIYFGVGFTLSNLFIIAVLTLKHFMVK